MILTMMLTNIIKLTKLQSIFLSPTQIISGKDKKNPELYIL